MVGDGRRNCPICRRLEGENSRLKALLTSHGIPWEEEPSSVPEPPAEGTVPATTQLTAADKVALFRRLFRGRSDVYPLRWESTKGTSGYSPACGNEWRPGVCHKPKDVRIYDYVETDQAQLARMWDKRQRGYRAMGYQIRPMDALISGKPAIVE